jgi:hypothetical protein
MDPWLIVNALGFIGAPAGLIGGLVAYKRLPERRSIRPRMSLFALVCAMLSAFVLVATIMLSPFFGLRTTNGAGLILIRCGVYPTFAGTALSLAGKPRLILLGMFANIGMFALWFGLTIP